MESRESEVAASNSSTPDQGWGLALVRALGYVWGVAASTLSNLDWGWGRASQTASVYQLVRGRGGGNESSAPTNTLTSSPWTPTVKNSPSGMFCCRVYGQCLRSGRSLY